MALRVLLADESTTIKKVMQVALQDFSVEVKAVHAGIDVVEVAKAFQPDIIFADVLLQKKNGYEVCGEIKRDAALKNLPVVLMWSSFLNIDEKQASQCGANQRLEKPFDVETLRQLILELVPKTRSQRLAHFLKFPEETAEPLRTEEQNRRGSARAPVEQVEVRPAPPPPAPVEVPKVPSRPPQAPVKTPAPPQSQAPPPSSSWNMDSFEDISDFSGDLDSGQASDSEEAHAPLHLTSVPIHSAAGNAANTAAADLEDESFVEFKLSDLTETPRRQNPQAMEHSFAGQTKSSVTLASANSGAHGDDKSLGRIKIFRRLKSTWLRSRWKAKISRSLSKMMTPILQTLAFYKRRWPICRLQHRPKGRPRGRPKGRPRKHLRDRQPELQKEFRRAFRQKRLQCSQPLVT
jgi:CheY-like chemotaxis protein